jgi:prepilin-type N-terminal cleavage/methylation domain-containing protein
MIKYKSSQSGFSLVETLVAITILLLVIIGPMTISSSTAKSTSFASEQVQAFFLAQEGIEIVIKERDSALLKQFLPNINPSYNPNAWDDFVGNVGTSPLDDCFKASNTDGCGLDLNDDGTLYSNIDCGAGNACALKYYDSSGRAKYTHDSAVGVGTKFTRKIYMDHVGGSPSDEVQVRSVVEWRTGSLKDSQQVEVETYLFNVYDF